MNRLDKLLSRQGFAVVDGGLATLLERYGCDLNDPLWSAKVLLEQPELITRAHLEFFQAGADIAITASYQASLEGFMAKGRSRKEALALIAKSVELALEARSAFEKEGSNRTHSLIAGSIGPYGAFLADGSEYRGDYKLSQEELKRFHRPRMQALLEAGADLLAIETIPSLEEALVLCDLLTEFPKARSWISFSAKDAEHTSAGDRIEDCAKALETFGQIAAIGINCTAPGLISPLLRTLRHYSSKALLVYPNSGERYEAGNNRWERESSRFAFGEKAALWQREGACIIGGCCRVTPQDIAEIRSALLE